MRLDISICEQPVTVAPGGGFLGVWPAAEIGLGGVEVEEVLLGEGEGQLGAHGDIAGSHGPYGGEDRAGVLRCCRAKSYGLGVRYPLRFSSGDGTMGLVVRRSLVKRKERAAWQRERYRRRHYGGRRTG